MTKTNQPVYRLINHCCSICMGRLLELVVTSESEYEVRCAECGATGHGNHESLCWCGLVIGQFGNAFVCIRNYKKSPSLLNEIMVTEREISGNSRVVEPRYFGASKLTASDNPTYRIIGHCCSVCMGRILERRSGGVVEYRCSECGATGHGTHESICCCGTDVNGFKNILKCVPNHLKSPSSPSEITVIEVPPWRFFEPCRLIKHKCIAQKRGKSIK